MSCRRNKDENEDRRDHLPPPSPPPVSSSENTVCCPVSHHFSLKRLCLPSLGRTSSEIWSWRSKFSGNCNVKILTFSVAYPLRNLNFWKGHTLSSNRTRGPVSDHGNVFFMWTWLLSFVYYQSVDDYWITGYCILHVFKCNCSSYCVQNETCKLNLLEYMCCWTPSRFL